MDCTCSSAAGCARWIIIFLLLAAGIAISIYHSIEVAQCRRCEERPNELGELERICTKYKGGRDMNWSGLCGTILTSDLESCPWLFKASCRHLHWQTRRVLLQAWRTVAS